MVDFHTHTIFSDGCRTREEIIEAAIDKKLSYLAITDHNMANLQLEELQEKYKDKIHLINGVEVSTRYDAIDGSCQEIHVVGLGIETTPMRKFLRSIKHDRSGYVNAIKEKLWKNCRIQVPDYEEMQKIFPKSNRIGRASIADYMTDQGITADRDEAFQIYLGNSGEKKAYVDSLDYCGYAPFEEGIQAIINAGGIPVLAHLFTYRYDEEESRRMIRRFKDAVGEHRAAMEVFYKRYSMEQQMQLKEYADEYQLLYSSASDFHGKRKGEDLMDPSHLDGIDLNRHVVTCFV